MAACEQPRAFTLVEVLVVITILAGLMASAGLSSPVPLVLLKHRQIVDPAVVAELNAKVKHGRPARHEAAHQPVRRERAAAVAELPERRERSGFFLFNLFGG